MKARPPIPNDVEEFRDLHWHREGRQQVETALAAERFIEQVGFAACLTDSRRPGPSLYVAVCGRRDAEVVYQPRFTYLWTLGIGRFDGLRQRISRERAVREVARCFLAGAGMTFPGELARVTGLSRPEAGRGNRALVAEGHATMLARGWYQLASRDAEGNPGSRLGGSR